MKEWMAPVIPVGLSGHEIILEARILGVVDVVDAMCYARSYRPALGFEAALNEIKSQRGILYDTHVVDAYLTLFGQEIPNIDQIKPLPAVAAH